MATKFALQAASISKFKSHQSGLLLSAKGVNTLKFGTFTQLGIGNGNSAIRIVCAFNPNRIAYQAFGDSGKGSTGSDGDTVPTPMVSIDQSSDPNATIVEMSFGDRLGALLDTMRALQDLGLDVAKASVSTEASITRTKFFITRLDTGRKVEDPEVLEKIRLTIINNLLTYHPESSERLAMGEAFGTKPPKKKLDVDVATHIHIEDDGPRRSTLYLETADRPGLLLEIIKVIIDSNVTVESAKIDTEGLAAKDKFYVSYQGAALNNSIAKVLTNSLRYYLRRPKTDEGSY